MAIRSARGPERARDDAEFFAACSQLRRSIDGLDGALEWPTLRAMLPDLTGRSVLDLGCGFGWFCRRAAITGAARVVGIDLSERMLTSARAEHDDRIKYQTTGPRPGRAARPRVRCRVQLANVALPDQP